MALALVLLLPATAVALAGAGKDEGHDVPTVALNPTSVTWEAIHSQEEVRGKIHCKHHSRISYSSLLGGIAVGVLVALPLAAVATDRLCPMEPAETRELARTAKPTTTKPTRTKTWSPFSLMGAGDEDELESLSHFWPRCLSLCCTLLIQSISSIILSHFNNLIATHPAIILFLTTVVGLGGNAGGQSTVLTVRRLALGQTVYVSEQTQVGILLSLIVGPLLLARTLLQGAALNTSLTIVFSSVAITIVATTLGCGLPKFLWRLGIDPAHGSSFIQVAMDILGILIVCLFGVVVLK